MKRAQTSYFIVYLVLAVMLVLAAAIFVPLGKSTADTTYNVGETVLETAKTRSAEINNASIRSAISLSIDEAVAEKENNIDMIQNFFQYFWIVVLIMTAFMIFVYTRKYAAQGGLL